MFFTIERVNLSYFLPALMQDDSFRVALDELYDKEDYSEIIDSIRAKNGVLGDDDLKEKEFVDSISGEFRDASEYIGKMETVVYIGALGGYNEEFTIHIIKMGPAYIVRAPEFDDEYFFKNKEEAEKWARGNYESFITSLETARRESKE